MFTQAVAGALHVWIDDRDTLLSHGLPQDRQRSRNNAAFPVPLSIDDVFLLTDCKSVECVLVTSSFLENDGIDRMDEEMVASLAWLQQATDACWAGSDFGFRVYV